MKIEFKKGILFFGLLCLIFASTYSAQYQLNPLKILFVTDKFPYEPRQYINNQIMGLLDRGHEVYILADEIGQYLTDSILINKYKLLQRTYYGDFPEKLKSVDIVYCQFGGLGDYCLQLIKQHQMKAKLVVCFRGNDATADLQIDPGKYEKLFAQADLFMPVCSAFKNRLIKAGCPPAKIAVHHSGINVNMFVYRPRKWLRRNQLNIVSSARLVEKKGLEYAIQAIAQVKKKYPNVCYKIIGDGSQRPRLEKLVNQLGLEKEVLFLGHLSHTAVLQTLYQSHIFLLPSITSNNGTQEGISNSVMEAMATGMPVVSTDHSGTSELIEDGISGFLVAERSVDQLVDKLIYLIENTQCWDRIGLAARKSVTLDHDREKLNNAVVRRFRLLLANS